MNVSGITVCQHQYIFPFIVAVVVSTFYVVQHGLLWYHSTYGCTKLENKVTVLAERLNVSHMLPRVLFLSLPDYLMII